MELLDAHRGSPVGNRRGVATLDDTGAHLAGLQRNGHGHVFQIQPVQDLPRVKLKRLDWQRSQRAFNLIGRPQQTRQRSARRAPCRGCQRRCVLRRLNDDVAVPEVADNRHDLAILQRCEIGPLPSLTVVR